MSEYVCERASERASAFGDIWRRTNNWYFQLAALIGYNRTRSERRVDVVGLSGFSRLSTNVHLRRNLQLRQHGVPSTDNGGCWVYPSELNQNQRGHIGIIYFCIF